MKHHLCAALLALGLASSATAQLAVSGYVLCPPCSSLVNTTSNRAVLWAFVDPSADGAPDLMWDETALGGIATCGTSLVDGGYLVVPNFRTMLGSGRNVRVLITNGTWIMADSGDPWTYTGDFGFVDFQQAAGALAGHLAPDVQSVGSSGLDVSWTPLREHGDDPALACSPAGASPRGFIIGYDVYRLPVSTYPAPTLRDFVLYGGVSFADLRLLDFSVADPDGFSGSDLEPADNLRLVNPDGLPDTGDEVLVYRDPAGAPIGTYWYRLQPIVSGNADYLATIPSCWTGPPLVGYDLDADGMIESHDLTGDGRIDFIDPTHHGLGLTWNGEILSSPQPGLGDAAPGSVGCEPIPREVCDNGTDDDTDGLADCADPECCSAPGCAMAAVLSAAPTTVCPRASVQVDATGSSPGGCSASLEYRFEAPLGVLIPGGDWGAAPVRNIVPGWAGTRQVFSLARCTGPSHCVVTSAPVAVTVAASPGFSFPSALTVTVTPGCGRRVSWLAASGAGPFTYDVYRSDTRPVPIDAAHLVASGLTATEWLDSPPPLGSWSYRVVAHDPCTAVPNGGGDSAPLARLAFPSALSVTREADCRYRVTWGAATTGAGPVTYDVYRAGSLPVPLDAAHLVASGLAVPSHVDAPPSAGDWSYRVVATDVCESLPNGGGDSAPLPRLLFPSTVRAALEGACGIRVSWDPATTPRTTLAYDVYRDAASPVPLDAAHLVASGVSATTWLDGSAWGAAWRYRVVARDDCDSRPDDAGDSTPVTVVDATPPSFAGIVDTRDMGFCQVEVSWDESTALDDCSGTGGYSVYRDNGVAHAGQTLVASGILHSPYVDTTPGNGTWVYVVRATDRAGNRESNAVFRQESEGSCTNDFPQDAGQDNGHHPHPPSGHRAPGAPGDPRVLDPVEIRQRMAAGDMRISWLPSSDEGGLYPVTYSVLRGTLAGLHATGYDHALVAPGACGIAAHEYMMTGQLDGVASYYLVVAVSGDNATFGYDSRGRELPAVPVCE